MQESKERQVNSSKKLQIKVVSRQHWDIFSKLHAWMNQLFLKLFSFVNRIENYFFFLIICHIAYQPLIFPHKEAYKTFLSPLFIKYYLILHKMNKGYLGEHPQLYKKINATTSFQRYNSTLEPVNLQEMAQEFILEQKDRIYDLQMRIKAYEIKIKEEKSKNLDHSSQISALQQQVSMIRRQQGEIVQQINNCRKVENQVAPMEYYLWKKKQRVNTFDASIAQLCREVEQQREYLERSIQQHRRLNEQYFSEIEQLQQKIANFNGSQRSSINPLEVIESQQLEELFGQNIALKEECAALSSTNSILEQNRQIVGMQVVDNIDSMVATIKGFYEQEKTKLVREFKQLQAQAKNIEVSPLTREQQSYTIEPLLNDYAHKMGEMLALAPEEVRKYIQPVLQPLPWKSFNWNQFLQINSNTQSIYDQYTRLEKQFIGNQKQTEGLQAQMRKINNQIANQQQKYNQIIINISKLKKKLQK